MKETRQDKNDLISRNAMLRHFSDWQMECSSVGSEREYNLLDMVIKGIKNQPSAFDVEKVVQELERLENYSMEKAADYDEKGETKSMEIADAYADAYSKAIKIVKKGGV